MHVQGQISRETSNLYAWVVYIKNWSTLESTCYYGDFYV